MAEMHSLSRNGAPRAEAQGRSRQGRNGAPGAVRGRARRGTQRWMDRMAAASSGNALPVLYRTVCVANTAYGSSPAMQEHGNTP